MLLSQILCHLNLILKRFLGNANNAGIIDAEIAVPLKHLSNFWRFLELDLISWKTNLILTQSEIYVISEGNREAIFEITDTKLYILFAVLSTQDDSRLLQQLKNNQKNNQKYQSKELIERQSQYFNYLIEKLGFQRGSKQTFCFSICR